MLPSGKWGNAATDEWRIGNGGGTLAARAPWGRMRFGLEGELYESRPEVTSRDGGESS